MHCQISCRDGTADQFEQYVVQRKFTERDNYIQPANLLRSLKNSSRLLSF